MEHTEETTRAKTRAEGFRRRMGDRLGSDLEPMLEPVRRALRERSIALEGDTAAAAMQLLSEAQLAAADAFAQELILVVYEEMRGPAD
ncbi:hypothetical protein ASA1KI_12910 [Opitutales bacterium ASA1]|nr:hypothetical protein ASA1KI_12910 [Opitutales bacterium ASA1]